MGKRWSDIKFQKDFRMTSQLELEKSVLGAIFLEPKSYYKIADIVTADHFLNSIHVDIWSILSQMIENKKPIDLVTFTSELQNRGQLADVGGASYLGELIDYVPTAANIRYYASKLDDGYKNRKIKGLAPFIELLDGDPDDQVQMIQSQLLEITSKDSAEVMTMRDIGKQSIKSLESRYNNRGQLLGISTTIPELDRATLGLCPTDLIIIAGRPSMGKTAFALQIFAEAGRAMFFSLEMGGEQLFNRQWSSNSKVNLRGLRSGDISHQDFSTLFNSIQNINNREGLICDHGGLDIFKLKNIARREHMKKPLNAVFVDYLQLVTAKNTDSRNQEVGKVSRELKGLAKELKVPVIALSQLSRKIEERSDPTPQMSDLRDSGEIEQDADVIIFPYRPSVYCDECKEQQRDCKGHEKTKNRGIDFYKLCKIIIAKQRNDSLATVETYFDGATQRFSEIDRFRGDVKTGRLYDVHA